MFSTKQDKLFEVKKTADNSAKTTGVSGKTSKSNIANQFLFGAAKKSAKVLSGNGAKKYSTSNSIWVDQFTSLDTYKAPRSFKDISNDCAALYAENPELFVKFTVYMRMISRKTDIFTLGIKTQEAQSGAELRHESIMRMIWLANKNPEAFWINIGLFVSAGSCKDIFTMLRQDLIYHGWDNKILDWDKFSQMILSLLENSSSVNLMKKYLPQIKSNSACTTVESQANNMIAKWICSVLYGGKQNGKTYQQYRRLKTSGTAHQWQQLISQKKFNRIDFGKIHGRALNLLVRGKFLKNQNLQDVYAEWASSQKRIKYTGYVHELLCELSKNKEKNFVDTVDKQFVEVVEKVKESNENLTSMIVVRDTSASMGSLASGSKYSCYDVAKSLALYFSEFLSGTFSGHWIEFNRDAKLHQWKGQTASEKWFNDHSSYVGTTDFLSVVRLFCGMLRKGTPEKDFPSGIICISDGEFDQSHLGKTNVSSAMKMLRDAGFSKGYLDNFKIVLWNLSNGYYHNAGPKFETFGDVKNVFYMSGYSASNVKFILNNKVETAQDLFDAAMDQELLNLVQVN